MSLKKELDKNISEMYLDFTRLCFVSFSGWEHEEKIKSLYEIRQEQNVEWKDDWIPFFDTKNVVDAITMKKSYAELIECFRMDMGL